MRVPISWLREFVEIDITPEEVAEKLTLAGFEVGTLDYIGVPQNHIEGLQYPPSDHLVWDREKILLGAIREIKPHPDADKLVLAMVDFGADELEQCVTGAPNLHPFVGQELDPPLWTALALEGAEVWDGHSDEDKRMILEGRELRGIYNKSMVCSDKELGISDAHEGVILLDHRDEYVPGTPLQDVLGDVVLDIELTPNLGHGFSMLGVARELAALTDKALHEPSYEFLAEGDPIDGQVSIEIRTPELNPRFTLTLLKNTAIKQSPFWMRHRLRLVGQRPRNNIVDVTNYITFEIGQPLHAFDYDKLVERAGGKAPKIITRLPEKGETLVTLDDVERELGDNQILVCDEAGVLSLGGLIGGDETEISDETTNVLLEAASWNFINIRKTAQAQKIFTEAGTRFSRNVHPSRAILGAQRGIELMRQTGGGTIAEGVIDEYPLPPEPVEIELPISEVHRLLGIELSLQDAADVLARLQFDVTMSDAALTVVVPDYRTDISPGRVGIADLVEEIARVYGYDKIPYTIIADEMPEQQGNPYFSVEEGIRDTLVALGLTENISYRFTTPEAEAQLVPRGAESSFPSAKYVELANPIASDKTVLRHTLWRNMLENARRNARFEERQMVFEIGSIYLKGDDPLPEEPARLGILMTGKRHEYDWTGAESTTPFDFFDLKGVIASLLNALHIANYSVERTQHTTLHPGRGAALHINGTHIGDFGELHPRVAQTLAMLDAPVLIAELDLTALIEASPRLYRVEELPTTPAVLEDIALVLDVHTPAAEVERVIREAGGDVLKDVRLFDLYEGENLGPGKRSLAYALTYQTNEKTLKDKDVKKIRKRIIGAVEKELGATLRS